MAAERLRCQEEHEQWKEEYRRSCKEEFAKMEVDLRGSIRKERDQEIEMVMDSPSRRKHHVSPSDRMMLHRLILHRLIPAERTTTSMLSFVSLIG